MTQIPAPLKSLFDDGFRLLSLYTGRDARILVSREAPAAHDPEAFLVCDFQTAAEMLSVSEVDDGEPFLDIIPILLS